MKSWELFLADLVLLISLLGLSALFSGSEVSIFSLKDTEFQKIKTRKNIFTRSLRNLLENKSSALIVILVGNLIVNVFLSSKVSQLAMKNFGEAGLAPSVFFVTALLIVFSEITPKTIALKNAANFALLSAPILVFLKRTVYPIIKILDQISEAILNVLFGKKKENEDGDLSTDELATMVSLGEQQGVFHGWEKKLIEQIFEFHEVYAVERMVPRPDIIAVELNESRLSISEKLTDFPYSKMPVYEKDLDTIVAYFQVKDFLLFPEKSLQEIMKPVYLIPERKPLDKLLQEMQIKNLKLAVLLDEYGNTQGIISIEEVLESIFGEWRDPEKITEEEEIQTIGSGLFKIDAAVTCREINTHIGEDIFDDEELEPGITIAGFLVQQLNRIPKVGDKLQDNNFVISVLEMEDRRILWIELNLLLPGEEQK